MSKYKVDITGINTSNLEVLKNTEMLDLFLEYQGGDLLAKGGTKTQPNFSTYI